MLRRAVPNLRQLSGHGLRFSSTSKSDVAESPVASTVQQASAVQQPVSPQTVLQYKNFIKRYKVVPNQDQVAGCRELVDVREIMRVYRTARDDPERVTPLPASDVVDAIMTSTRRRSYVLRSLISKLRRQIIAKQNEELSVYLHEVVADVVSGKVTLSRYAITYLLTTFAAMEKRDEATLVWKKLTEVKGQHNIGTNMFDPRVVGAVITTADPSTFTLDSIMDTYNETKEQYGSHILLDIALISAYVQYAEYNKAAELYASILETYSLREWQEAITRIHNRIIGGVKDSMISSTFFEMAIKPDSHISKLHPSAAGAFFGNYYNEKNDYAFVFDRYKEAVSYYKERVRLPGIHYQSMTTEFLKVVFKQFPLDTQDGRDAITEVINFNEVVTGSPSPLLQNTILSSVYKHWPQSPFIADLAGRLSKIPDLEFDSYRVLLNAAGACSAIENHQVAEWWNARVSIKPKLQFFDWLSMINACNYADRVAVFSSAISEAANSSGITSEVLDRLETALARNPIVEEAVANLQKEGKLPKGGKIFVFEGFDEETVLEESEAQSSRPISQDNPGSVPESKLRRHNHESGEN